MLQLQAVVALATTADQSAVEKIITILLTIQSNLSASIADETATDSMANTDYTALRGTMT